jgi:ribonuclease-3 family protein
MKELLNNLKAKTKVDLNEDDIRMLNPLVLAFLGDTLYDLFIRTYLVYTHKEAVHQLHSRAVGFVKASAQSDAYHKIQEFLTDEERDMVRRGRNAKSGTVPKNADVGEYRWATGLECLLGYLYLMGREERMYRILGYILEQED